MLLSIGGVADSESTLPVRPTTLPGLANRATSTARPGIAARASPLSCFLARNPSRISLVLKKVPCTETLTLRRVVVTVSLEAARLPADGVPPAPPHVGPDPGPAGM